MTPVPGPFEALRTADLWDLAADPAALEASADAWRATAASLTHADHAVADPAARIVGDTWTGDAADSYLRHLGRLGTSVDTTVSAAHAVARALDSAATTLRSGQQMLDDDLRAVAARVATSRGGGTVVFAVRTVEEIALVDQAVVAAERLRADLDAVLAQDTAAVAGTVPTLTAVSTQWENVAAGTADDWSPAPEQTDTQVVYAGDDVIIDAGAGDDHISVSTDPATGLTTVTVNGTRYVVPQGKHLVVRAGSGNDVLDVPAGTSVDFTVLGGTGNDEILTAGGRQTVVAGAGDDQVLSGAGDDRVSGGWGTDYLETGTGDDVASGGQGRDTLYGMDGADRLSGGEGDDYLEGATGDDTLDGDSGKDTLSTGRGDDTARGGSGDDVLYSVDGRDSLDGGAGADTVYGQDDDSVTGTEKRVTVQFAKLPDSITIEGSPEFKARVQADLDLLAASPTGQQMLAALQKAHDDTKAVAADWPVLGHVAYQGDTFTIREFPHAELNSTATANPVEIPHVYTFSQHPEVRYDPRFNTLYDGPPIAVLYHELAHVYDFEYGTWADGTTVQDDGSVQKNGEREAVGLPIDHDGDPSTPLQPAPGHPFELTENGLRKELGAPARPRY